MTPEEITRWHQSRLMPNEERCNVEYCKPIKTKFIKEEYEGVYHVGWKSPHYIPVCIALVMN